MNLKIPFFLFTFFSTIGLLAQNANPIELGKVNWLRSLDEGMSLSNKKNKPIFLLFQEVPGCSTCRNYGQDVLSHPLIVEAIEELFIPLAIYNNKQGEDAKILKYFGEPAWNNPVVRIINAEKENLIPRLSGNYTQLGVVQAMTQALQANHQKTPNYLALLEQELIAEKIGTETATFSMYCFWTGEKELGKLNGVLETQAGFMDGREVVKVKFDPEVIDYKKLVGEAQKAQCASHIYTNNNQQIKEAEKIAGKGSASPEKHFRLDSTPKYYLSKTIYRFVPMTQLQAAKVNSLIGSGKSPSSILSPRQLALAAHIQANPKKRWKNAINEDLVEAWKGLENLDKL